jgi:hypothetical protein
MSAYDDWASSFSTSVQAVVDEQTKAKAMRDEAASIPYVAPTKVTVKPGDTLSAIAKANNMTLAEIRAINPTIMNTPKYNDGNMIWSGTKIVVDPGSGTKPKVTTPVVTSPVVTSPVVTSPVVTSPVVLP